MEENNYQFRIWDNREKKWMDDKDIYLSLKGDVCRYSTYDVIPDDTRVPSVNALQKERFEISQYIGRSDSKGVKAYTGDTISLFVRKTGEPSWEETGDIQTYKGNAYFSVNGIEKYVLTSEFTIIGNKWEGIWSQKGDNLSGSGGDSTGQQQSAKPITEEDIFDWRNNIRKPIAEIWELKFTMQAPDAFSEKENIHKEKKSKFVPYQLCPKCSGQKKLSKPPGLPAEVISWITDGSLFDCDMCDGTGKILMHKLQ